MSTYAIGDVQGCYAELIQLLMEIQFDPDLDTLWFTGDLVNRGPRSLEVLRFIKKLGNKHKVILGNHDLHLLAVAYGVKNKHVSDTLDAILEASDRDELLDWLRHRELLHYDKTLECVMTHAGIAPIWSLQKARELAQEVETALRDSPMFLLKNIYGNEPSRWDDQLSGTERLRCITNYLTRMRFCYADGQLDLAYKGQIAGKPDHLIPWFAVPDRVNINAKIIFGHWAALGGKTDIPRIYAVDTGCVWGNCLTAMRLEDEKRFTIQC